MWARVATWLEWGGGVWRVGHRGRDHVFYEERHCGELAGGGLAALATGAALRLGSGGGR